MTAAAFLPHDRVFSGRARLAAGVIVFVVVAVLQLALERATLRPYDEGLILYGAARVAEGGVPYRDFWSMYGPGSYYALAGLARIVGESVLTGRVLDVASRAAIVMLVFALTRRGAGRATALVAAGVAFVQLVVVREYLAPSLPATAFALLCLHALARVLRERAPGSPPGWTWAWAGAAAGATLIFRPDFGFGALFACLWVLWVPFGPERVGMRRAAAASLALLGSAIVVAAPLYVWLLTRMPVAQLYDNLVRIPMTVYAANRSLPFPDPIDPLRHALKEGMFEALVPLTVCMPPLVLLLGFAVAIARRRRGASQTAGEGASGRLFEAVLVLAALLCAKGSFRVDLVQMLPAMLVCVVVVGLAVPDLRRMGTPGWRGAASGFCLLGAFALALGSLRTWRTEQPLAKRFAERARCAEAGVPRLGCFVLDADRLAVLRYLAQHARAGDTLYVGTGRHDKLFVNNVELYFLSGLPAATRWADLHPGVQTTAARQQAMIAEMTDHPPAFVVVNTEWDDVREPNASRVSSGVTLLDDYLRQRYVPVLRSGTLTVSVARATAPP